jgi:hypothetical protein
MKVRRYKIFNSGKEWKGGNDAKNIFQRSATFCIFCIITIDKDVIFAAPLSSGDVWRTSHHLRKRREE